MDKFKIQPDKKESVNKTIRFPLDLSEKISTTAQQNNTSFTSVVIQACEFALNNMEEIGFKNKKDKKD